MNDYSHKPMLRKASHHLINYRMLLRVVGWLLLIEAVFLLFPAFTSLAYGEADWLPFAATACGTALTGGLLATRTRPTSSHMGKRDGYLLTASVWIVFSIFGLIPLSSSLHTLTKGLTPSEPRYGLTVIKSSSKPL